MRSGKPAFRLYGAVTLSDAAMAARLADTLPHGAARQDGASLDVDYAGHWVDVDAFLDLAATLLQPGQDGHLDVFDDDEGRITRYDLLPGAHQSVSHRYDDILEHTKGEGNW
uniref:Uncharacterized protein n=1 Tax=Fundidesulfovibrio putealis TaxID=270496 RepID=A0A7C4AI13_9BACT